MLWFRCDTLHHSLPTAKNGTFLQDLKVFANLFYNRVKVSHLLDNIPLR